MPAEYALQVSQIEQFPEQLAKTLDGLSETQVSTVTSADIWTIQQIVHHIADSHMNAFIRMRLLLTENHPTIKPYDQDAWAALADVKTVSVAVSLALITALHTRWAAMMSALSSSEWERTGMHPEYGAISVASMVASYARHGNDHIAQIERVKAAL